MSRGGGGNAVSFYFPASRESKAINRASPEPPPDPNFSIANASRPKLLEGVLRNIPFLPDLAALKNPSSP